VQESIDNVVAADSEVKIAVKKLTWLHVTGWVIPWPMV
jgi:hypothetical protein